MALTARQRQVMRDTIALEAENQGPDGMAAVGEVLRNRANDKRFRRFGDIEGQALAPKQFSAWNDRKLAASRLKKMRPDIVAQADRAVDESEKSTYSRGANHYYAPKSANPSWSKKFKETSKVKDHRFMSGY